MTALNPLEPTPQQVLLVSEHDRDQMWRDYDRWWPALVLRCVAGSWWYVAHRLTRWWKLKPVIGALQYLHVAAFLTLMAMGGWAAFSSVGGVKEKAPRIIAFFCGALIIWYKWASQSAGKVHESERRQTVTSLLAEINHSDALNHESLDDQHRDRLACICECVRRDAEEYLNLPEAAIKVIVIRQVRSPGNGPHGGHLEEVARDRRCGRGYFATQRRAPLEAFVYEAIRQRRTVCFHNVRTRGVKKYFGKCQGSYRCVFCMPITPSSGNEAPNAILSLQITRPYVLWPFRSEALDRRLTLYVELIRMFLPREA